jgi:uncharacterized protein YaeQ
MSQGAVLYRFRLDISDVDRSVYEKADFRLALHASESLPFLLTRMLAYALNLEAGLAFSAKGLAEPEEPCISSEDPRGGKGLWIEVGNPSARRLHKAAKAAKKVKVYTYKNPEALLKEMKHEKVHRLEEIEIYSLTAEFLAELEALLGRDNEWSIYRDQGSLMITVGEDTIEGELGSHRA